MNKQFIKGYYVSSMSSLAKKIDEEISNYNNNNPGFGLNVNIVTPVICESQMIDCLVVYDIVTLLGECYGN